MYSAPSLKAGHETISNVTRRVGSLGFYARRVGYSRLCRSRPKLLDLAHRRG